MKAHLRNSAPWIIAGITAMLSAAFCLALGSERISRTTYQRLEGLVVSLAPIEIALPAVADNEHPATPIKEEARGTQKEKLRHAKGRQAHSKAGAPDSSVPPRAPYPDPSDRSKTGSSPLEVIPQPLQPPPAHDIPANAYSLELVRDAFDAEPSKFPLDKKVWSENILLRLVGLCRWQGHYILKVSLTNQGNGDFFVRELTAYDSSEVIVVKSYFRLFVEAGRTRDGYVVFGVPRPGTEVKIVLKEDREKGRVIETPVAYPF